MSQLVDISNFIKGYDLSVRKSLGGVPELHFRMVNYYSLETLGTVFNTDKERIEEIIATHENGQNQFQDDPTSVFSNV